MFKGIVYNSDCTWTVCDSRFEITLTYSGPGAIIKAYTYHKINPISALKLYYERLNKQDRKNDLNADNNNYYLGVPYDNKYYLCLQRHLAKLNYIGR